MSQSIRDIQLAEVRGGRCRHRDGTDTPGLLSDVQEGVEVPRFDAEIGDIISELEMDQLPACSHACDLQHWADCLDTFPASCI